jgi:hypothetical protein
MQSNFLQLLSIKSGKDISYVKRMWNLAKKEAEEMGMKDNYAYTARTLENLLDLQEDYVIEQLTDLYLLSEDQFEEEMTSLGFQVTPEVVNKKIKGKKEKNK